MSFKLTRIAIAIVTVAGTLMLSSVAAPAFAGLSPETGTIVGRAPTVTGNLLVAGPHGDVQNGAALDATTTPNSYTLSADLSELILHDADGDLGLAVELNQPNPALVWKDGATTLTSIQLGRTFSAAGSVGKTLTVTVSPLVRVSTTTGDPRSATTSLPQTYTLMPHGSSSRLMVRILLSTQDSQPPDSWRRVIS